MTGTRTRLRLFLDEGVPDSVARAFEAAGHEAHLLRNNLARGSEDPLVCAAAEVKECILVALDGDMKQIAKGHGVTGRRYKALSLIKLSCFEPDAASRVAQAMSLIEHEWNVAGETENRRIFVEVSDRVIRTFR